MQYGLVKVCAATVPIRVADIQYNIENIITAIREAVSQGAEVVVFQELGVTGYTCGDLFLQTHLLKKVEEAIQQIVEQTKEFEAISFVGFPFAYNGKLFNCAAAICKGEILAIIPKTAIPNYSEFYEKRHFTSAKELSDVQLVDYAGCCDVLFGTNILLRSSDDAKLTLACEICEDLWVPQSPSVAHAMNGANIIVNLSCSDEIVGKSEYRRDLVKMQSGKLVCGYVYTDSGDGESTTDMVFAGHNIISENGGVLAQSKLFENGLVYAEIDVEKLDFERRRMSSTFYTDQSGEYYEVPFSINNQAFVSQRQYAKMPFIPQSKEKIQELASLILTIQSKGLEKRLAHTHTKTAVLGISGGLDSALALLVTVRAFDNLGMDRKNILAITMPGFGTTGKTYQNSLKLMESLGVTIKTISIKDSVLQHFKDIEHDVNVHDVTYENSQARMRTMILMNIANQSGGMVIGTGDLSELALGWATYNGDHMSMYAVNASIPKTLVKYLIACESARIGGQTQEVLDDILGTEISPELLPPDKDGKISQKTEDLVGPYILHDFFLYYAIRWGFPPQKIQSIAYRTFQDDFSKDEIDKWLKNFYRRFFNQQFKRSCMPDGVKVGSVTLSPRGDWRMPSDAISQLWLEQL